MYAVHARLAPLSVGAGGSEAANSRRIYTAVTVANTGSVTVSNNALLDVRGAVTNNAGGTINVIAGSTLQATGQTITNNGTFNLSGAATASSVANPGLLRGGGTLTGGLAVQSGGTVAPGDSVGTLTVGATTFSPGGHYDFEYHTSATAPVAGTDNDLLTGSTLSLAGLSSGNRFNLDVSALNTGPAPTGPTTYTFAQFTTITGATPGNVTSLFNVTGQFSGPATVTLTDGGSFDTLSVTFTPVPEPSALLAVGAAGLVAVGWLRRVARPSARRG
jgi:hypothetical protein